MANKKFDENKYEISEEMPQRFAQVIPGIGVQHFNKNQLTDNDMKALLSAKNRYVKSKGDIVKTPERKEAKPEYKDIDAGKFPK